MFFQNPPSKTIKPRIIIQTKTQNYSSKNAKPRIYFSKIYKPQNYSSLIYKTHHYFS